jgi:hypothetical protein
MRNSTAKKQKSRKGPNPSPLTTKDAKKIIRTASKPIKEDVDMDFGSDLEISEDEEMTEAPEVEEGDEIVVYEAKDEDDEEKVRFPGPSFCLESVINKHGSDV